MTKKPWMNAFAALAYIVVVVSVMNYLGKHTKPDESAIAPIAFLSLFTLSAAVMGYIFVFQPLRLYLDGEKKAAVALFLQTVGIFAGITVLVLLMLVAGVLS